MREWQVGDPAGDGNDIGVPDLKYMRYLDDDEDDEDDVIDDFNGDMNRAMWKHKNEDYDDAFYSFKLALKDYARMNRRERSWARHRFDEYFVVDLCCWKVNQLDDDFDDALGIIKRFNMNIKVCADCNRAYPSDYDYCTECGKDLNQTPNKSPEELAEEIPSILRKYVLDDAKIAELTSRSLYLMKSNDSRIVEISGGFEELYFIFEKEHKYFKTIYRCIYAPYASGRIFDDVEVTHDHEKLHAAESFKKLVKDTEMKTGFTYRNSDGGYDIALDDNRYDFVFTDKIRVYVRFDTGDGGLAVYDLDVDNMKLSDEYDLY
ncbi:hypothetical protein [Methanobrevibacter millerae]|uniref:Zinc-ribbon domain-containing protein n=1 Tax=Methanobrevibacter millerae TaxID=230361 RepID=A0A1G5WHT2_9EURY|nr:hypothetical protein [Methanobrevibacter millerae]SDA57718.1 hypothetical protein SAMN02910315_01434 [Methanobrevibacter millerae]